jgi:hypothetical protein
MCSCHVMHVQVNYICIHRRFAIKEKNQCCSSRRPCQDRKLRPKPWKHIVIRIGHQMLKCVCCSNRSITKPWKDGCFSGYKTINFHLNPKLYNIIGHYILRVAGCGSALFQKFWTSHTYWKMIECMGKRGGRVLWAPIFWIFDISFLQKIPDVVDSVTKATTVHCQQLSQCPI